jgi:Cd2+/Zn2+-exporting ATPase
MDCADEAAALRKAVGPIVGEDNLRFDVLRGRMDVLVPAEESAVMAAVASTGMRATAWEDAPAADDFGKHRRALVFGSGAFVLAGFAAHAAESGLTETLFPVEGTGHTVPLLAKACYAGAVALAGFRVLPRAVAAARRVRPDMHLLMAIGVAAALVIGEWFEGATVAFLFLLALAIESWSVGRARRAVEAVLQLAPSDVHVVRDDGSLQDTDAKVVPTGTRFVVRPGERVPLDGRVVEGSSVADESQLTGESRPVTKEPGGTLFAGSINGDGALVAESTATSAESTVAHIARMVEEAQSRRAPVERWVDRFAAVYTPVVLGAALLAATLPPLVASAPWRESLYRGIALLVIACPCALVISVPVSLVAALAGAARRGLLVKGADALERAAGVRIVALDKTGTLTRGEPAVAEVVALDGHTEQELLEDLGALEARSEHPVALAIRRHVEAAGVSPPPVPDLTIVPGRGAIGTVRGRRHWVGSHRYLEELGEETPEVHARMESLAAGGRTVVFVGDERHVCGMVAVTDQPRARAPEAIAALRADGLRPIMLTGDNQETARHIGAAVGVTELRAELLPADKVRVVEELGREAPVAMVGDGVNDAPALARAAVGIAFGKRATGVAQETADVTVLSEDIRQVPWFLAHARRTLRIVRQNIAFSLVVKAVFVALAAFGHATLWGAVAADMGASLLVTLNGLRLLGGPRGADPRDSP